jgi:hypothetical protein
LKTLQVEMRYFRREIRFILKHRLDIIKGFPTIIKAYLTFPNEAFVIEAIRAIFDEIMQEFVSCGSAGLDQSPQRRRAALAHSQRNGGCGADERMAVEDERAPVLPRPQISGAGEGVACASGAWTAADAAFFGRCILIGFPSARPEWNSEFLSRLPSMMASAMLKLLINWLIIMMISSHS